MSVKEREDINVEGLAVKAEARFVKLAQEMKEEGDSIFADSLMGDAIEWVIEDADEETTELRSLIEEQVDADALLEQLDDEESFSKDPLGYIGMDERDFL